MKSGMFSHKLLCNEPNLNITMEMRLPRGQREDLSALGCTLSALHGRDSRLHPEPSPMKSGMFSHKLLCNEPNLNITMERDSRGAKGKI